MEENLGQVDSKNAQKELTKMTPQPTKMTPQTMTII